MKLFATAFVFVHLTFLAHAQCPSPVDILVVGDSQSGATWSKTYFGNFLASCLQGNFVIYGRGATVPANWIGSGGMDHIETIQRTSSNNHLNIGAGETVPLCKKRIGPMLEAHTPKKVLFQFGGNMITSAEDVVIQQVDRLMVTAMEKGIKSQNCFFLMPTYEMEVESRRNVPHRNLSNVQKINRLITQTIAGRCQVIDGLEVMKDSPYFDGKELLRRVPIEGKPGCGGAAVNDNVHVCGEAARDLSERVCAIIQP